MMRYVPIRQFPHPVPVPSRRQFMQGIVGSAACAFGGGLLTVEMASAFSGVSTQRYSRDEVLQYLSPDAWEDSREQQLATFTERATSIASASGLSSSELRKYIRLGEEAIYRMSPGNGFWPQTVRGLTRAIGSLLEG